MLHHLFDLLGVARVAQPCEKLLRATSRPNRMRLRSSKQSSLEIERVNKDEKEKENNNNNNGINSSSNDCFSNKCTTDNKNLFRRTYSTIDIKPNVLKSRQNSDDVPDLDRIDNKCSDKEHASSNDDDGVSLNNCTSKSSLNISENLFSNQKSYSTKGRVLIGSKRYNSHILPLSKPVIVRRNSAGSVSYNSISSKTYRRQVGLKHARKILQSSRRSSSGLGSLSSSLSTSSCSLYTDDGTPCDSDSRHTPKLGRMQRELSRETGYSPNKEANPKQKLAEEVSLDTFVPVAFNSTFQRLRQQLIGVELGTILFQTVILICKTDTTFTLYIELGAKNIILHFIKLDRGTDCENRLLLFIYMYTFEH